jgi:CheY-like chemotaxis protein
MGGSRLDHLRVLIVEDESLIAMLIEDALAELNCTVAAIASSLSDALDKVSSMEFDVAILDVNLNGSPSYPVAEILVQRRIPFIFSTGYGASGVPEAFRAVPVLAKPFREGDVGRRLEAAVKSRQSPEIKASSGPAARETPI